VIELLGGDSRFSPSEDLVNFGDAILIATNLAGCFNCLELARRAKADVILVSTSRVDRFGRLKALSFVEEESRFNLVPVSALPKAVALTPSPRHLLGLWTPGLVTERHSLGDSSARVCCGERSRVATSHAAN